jgi:hypothetical protein
MFPRNPGTTEIDHLPTEVHIAMTKQKRGAALQSIKEAVYDNPVFNDKIAEAIKDIMAERDPKANNDWGPTWIAIKRK